MSSSIVATAPTVPEKRHHEGKTALVTGASRSIGAAISANLAAKGANVCIIYRTEASNDIATTLASDLSSQHSVKCIPCRADISTTEGCASIIKTCEASLPANPKTGKFQVDILVNCAALFHTAPLEGVTVDDFNKIYTNNVLGPVLLTQACIPHLPTDRSGRVINVSSVGAKVGLQYLTLYGGAKGALETNTRTWARELAERCTVNCINPGATMTEMYRQAPHEVKAAMGMYNPMTPLSGVREWDTDEVKEMGKLYQGRPAYPEDVAGLVGMICSPESAWMTGCLISANGGQWMSS